MIDKHWNNIILLHLNQIYPIFENGQPSFLIYSLIFKTIIEDTDWSTSI